MARLVTFLSDFGDQDTYVGQVKGAILGVADRARIVDLTHRIPAHDVRAGAVQLWSAVGVFTPETVHLAVVDPGVGTDRRAIALQSARGDWLVGPDNGLLVPAALRLGGIARAVHLTESRFFRAQVGRTFHGRDVFGPVAGHLSLGIDPGQLGLPAENLVEGIRIPAPTREGGGVMRGEVIHVDVYGNLVTNVEASLLPQRSVIRIGDREIRDAPQPHYQAVGEGQLVAVVGSSDTLEISVRNGDAAKVLGARVGFPLTVLPR